MLGKVIKSPQLLSIASTLLPLGCLVCNRPLRNSLLCWRCRPPPPISPLGLCKSCYSPHLSKRSSMNGPCPTCELFPPPFDNCFYLWEYDRIPRDLIRSMKFNSSPRLARALGVILAENLINNSATVPWDVITFIPTSYRSGLSRRFNQCELMAHTVSSTIRKKLGIKVPVVELLKRSVIRAPHSTLRHQKRLTRLKELFRSTTKGRNRRILLIEDVITSGATVSAACYALRKKNVMYITVASLARSATWSHYRATVHERTADP
jgi:competence protein ComFC